MYTKHRYGIIDIIRWTHRETILFAVLASIPTVLHYIFGVDILRLPWQVVGLVGTAVAFMVGFQNNAAYNRIWEARTIWGGIVNCSRNFTLLLKTNLEVEDPDQKQKILNQAIALHCAWMTALRFRLRSTRKWEVFNNSISNRRWTAKIPNPEQTSNIEKELRNYLSEEDLGEVLSKPNIATAVLDIQSRNLFHHRNNDKIWYFSHLEIQKKISELIDLQGKCERIKEFPYPRQYATIGQVLVWVFILLLPYATIAEFENIGKAMNPTQGYTHYIFVWAPIPFVTLMSWIFHTMERVGRGGENPFEGTANDIPISTMSRNIEIEIKKLIEQDEKEIPEKLKEIYDVQM